MINEPDMEASLEERLKQCEARIASIGERIGEFTESISRDMKKAVVELSNELDETASMLKGLKKEVSKKSKTTR